MTRRQNTLGLIFIVLLVLSNLLASSASAQLEAESSPVTLTTSSNAMQKIAPVEGGTAIECTTLALDKSSNFAPSTEVAFVPTYSNCESILGLSTTVTTNGCFYIFHFNVALAPTEASFDISCPIVKDEGGKETPQFIELKVGNNFCKYLIGSQTGLRWVTFSNTGSGTTREVIFEPHVGLMKVERTVGGFGCPSGSSIGTLTGNFTVTGENSGGTIHIGTFLN